MHLSNEAVRPRLSEATHDIQWHDYILQNSMASINLTERVDFVVEVGPVEESWNSRIGNLETGKETSTGQNIPCAQIWT
jgi:hypothetical protein